MPNITIISQKGGSGKTTIALHLAASATQAKQPACVIDTDPQATAAAWGDWRGDFYTLIVTSAPARLAKPIERAHKQDDVEVVVIDTPPHAEAPMREAIKAADLVLIPSRPRAFDLHALKAVAEMIDFGGKPAYVVLTAVPAGATRQIAQAKETAKQFGLKTCPVTFGESADFHRSSAKGEVASEIDATGKPAAEAKKLSAWARKQVS